MAKKTKLQPEPVQTDTVPAEPVSASLPTKDHNLFSPDGELVIDVFETHSDFVVLAAIAGVQIKDLDISIEKEMMVIKGHRADPHGHPEKKFFYQECYWGPFSRKIVLPENIDTNAADAQMDKGMLTIKIPKISLEKTKKASVQES
ncbi:MAG TPA: Hsp20/alpha crystallin family protein [Negativicutes bacterium]|nr:Hsp20/alpha crystallin family protein [Negativicutes bacterium]